ncbi:MAG: HEPN domain-containing protein [Armatimonadota bacterium]
MEGKEQTLERAKQFLKSAKACWREEAPVGCALCCYAAMFWAAIAALMHVGMSKIKWRHDDVRRFLGLEIVKRRHLVPERFGEWLKDAYELRNDAHYKVRELSQKEVERTIRHA